MTPQIISFSANQSDGEAPLSVTFRCDAFDSNGYMEYRWDFDGDGEFDVVNTSGPDDFNHETSLFSVSVRHIYSVPGIYYATCTVIENGESVSRSLGIRTTDDSGKSLARVPDNVNSIQLAIDLMNDGDKMLVGPGEYFENLNISNKSISIISSKGAENTIINGSYDDSVIRINAKNVLIEGFTIKKGSGKSEKYEGGGGGISCSDSNDIIENNTIAFIVIYKTIRYVCK